MLKEASRQKQPNHRSKFLCLLAAVMAIFLCASWWQRTASPAWASEDVPVAFWSWRATAPTREDVQTAQMATHVTNLFIRAGQFDFTSNEIRRIRAVEGSMPNVVTLHLVYNATESLLSNFASVELRQFAATITEIYRQDAARFAGDGCCVVGLQLDFDAPTRLLPRYAELLRMVRARLASDVQLSITGLPTWMDSNAIGEALKTVDFWIPQFYGDIIPTRLEEARAIQSPANLRRRVEQARRLRFPFYAGLAAYSHLTLYTSKGELLLLRGDISPKLVARNPDLRLASSQPFITNESATSSASSVGEWRYVYQARRDTSVADINIKQGEHAVLNVPSGAGLRLTANSVREAGGKNLLGICVFRLPMGRDENVLTIEEIADALANRDARISTRVEAFKQIATQNEPDDKSRNGNNDGNNEASTRLIIVATNNGANSARIGDAAFAMILRVPRGSVQNVSAVDDSAIIETLCSKHNASSFVPCSVRRSDAMRITSPVWMVYEQARIALHLRGSINELPLEFVQHTDDGRRFEWRENIKTEFEIAARNTGEQRSNYEVIDER